MAPERQGASACYLSVGVPCRCNIALSHAGDLPRRRGISISLIRVDSIRSATVSGGLPPPRPPLNESQGSLSPLARRGSSWLLLVTFSELALAWLAFVCDVALACGVTRALVTAQAGPHSGRVSVSNRSVPVCFQVRGRPGGGLLLDVVSSDEWWPNGRVCRELPAHCASGVGPPLLRHILLWQGCCWSAR